MLVVCSRPTRCACSCAMMTAVCFALWPPRNVYETPPSRSLAQEGRDARDLRRDVAPRAAARRDDLRVEVPRGGPRQREDDVHVGVPLVEVRLDLALALGERRRERAVELRRRAHAGVGVRRRAGPCRRVEEIEDVGRAARGVPSPLVRALCTRSTPRCHGPAASRTMSPPRAPALGSPSACVLAVDRTDATPGDCHSASPPQPSAARAPRAVSNARPRGATGTFGQWVFIAAFPEPSRHSSTTRKVGWLCTPTYGRVCNLDIGGGPRFLTVQRS